MWELSTFKDIPDDLIDVEDNVILGMYSDKMYFKLLDKEKEPDI
jgi:hypothetical protein